VALIKGRKTQETWMEKIFEEICQQTSKIRHEGKCPERHVQIATIRLASYGY